MSSEICETSQGEKNGRHSEDKKDIREKVNAPGYESKDKLHGVTRYIHQRGHLQLICVIK